MDTACLPGCHWNWCHSILESLLHGESQDHKNDLSHSVYMVLQ